MAIRVLAWHRTEHMYRVSPFVDRFALALLAGVAIATLWVNLNPASYYDAIEFRLLTLPLPIWMVASPVILTPMIVVSHGLMALFMAFIFKELWEALVLERSPLAGVGQKRLPVAAVLGGLVGAVVVWLLVSWRIETAAEANFGTGWALPLGSDVVLCYFFGRLAFGRSHPALHLLLLISIAFDIIGLLVTGLAYPATPLRLAWLGLSLASVGLVWQGFARNARPHETERHKRRALQLWPYVLAGLGCWLGVALAGLPPALGLLPLVMVIPHSDRSFGLFAEAEELLHDPLNRFAQALVRPLALVLFGFGLTRGGIDFAGFAPTTLTVLAAFWIGKPLGLMLGVVIAGLFFGALLPEGVRLLHVALIGLISGLGFTVPVLAIDTALPGGAMAEAARLGLAVSLLAGPALLGTQRVRRMLRDRRRRTVGD